MPQKGGAAALNGFVFQLLNSAHRALHVELTSAKFSDKELVSAMKILEPEQDGDAQYLVGNKRLVDQYKTHSWRCH